MLLANVGSDSVALAWLCSCGHGIDMINDGDGCGNSAAEHMQVPLNAVLLMVNRESIDTSQGEHSAMEQLRRASPMLVELCYTQTGHRMGF